MSHHNKLGLVALMAMATGMVYRSEAVAGDGGGGVATAVDNSAPAVAVEAANKLMLNPNFDKFHDTKEFKFHFKKDDLGNKRPTVVLQLPVPSVEGIVDILTKEGNEKELELLRDAINDYVEAQARSIVNDKEDISQENFPKEKVLWAFIANLPKAERRGGGIPKETWEAFAADYIATMPAVTGKTQEQVGKAAEIFIDKFNKVKTNKPVLNKLKEQLGIYVTNSPKIEEFTACVEFLTNKADTLLAVDEAALLANL